MSTLSVRLPDSVHRYIKEIAKKEGVSVCLSVDQSIACAVAEKVSAIATEEYLQARAECADKNVFAAILGNVPDRTPLLGDEI